MCPIGEQSSLPRSKDFSFEHQMSRCISEFQFIESFEHLIEVRKHNLMEKQRMKQTYDNYYKEYESKNTKRVSLNLSTSKDSDIIKAIDGENIQGTIKRLIRQGMKANG